MGAGTDTAVIRAEGFDIADMGHAIQIAGDSFVDLLKTLDRSDGETQVPSLSWTVKETAAHMLSVLRRGLGDRRRADSVQGLRDLNDETVQELANLDVAEIALAMEADLDRYIPMLLQTPQDTAEAVVVKLHSHLKTDVPTALSYQLVDFLVHAFDIASALDRPWEIAPNLAVLGLRSCLPALGPWVTDKVLNGPELSLRFSFPDADFSAVVRTGQGAYSVSPASKSDSDPQVDPVEVLLAVCGRRTPTGPLVAQLAAWFEPI